jgi:Meiotically up-regulated gene 113
MATAVYILRSGEENLFKIGRARHVEERRKDLSTGNPYPLSVYGVIETEYANDCETYLHHRLRSKRSRRSDAHEFYEVDPPVLDDEIRGVHNFLAFLPTRAVIQGLAKVQSDDRILQPGPRELEDYRRLLKVREQLDSLEFEKEHLESGLKRAIGTASGLEGLAMWKTESVEMFDRESFKLAHPDLYGEFLRDSRRRTLRLL